MSSASAASSFLLRVAFPLDAPRVALTASLASVISFIFLAARSFPASAALSRCHLSAAFLYAFFVDPYRRSLGSFVQILGKWNITGVIRLFSCACLSRSAWRYAAILSSRQSPRLGRSALRDGFDDLQRGSKVGDGAVPRMRVPRVHLGARGQHPRARLRIRLAAPRRGLGTPSASPSGTLGTPERAHRAIARLERGFERAHLRVRAASTRVRGARTSPRSPSAV